MLSKIKKFCPLQQENFGWDLKGKRSLLIFALILENLGWFIRKIRRIRKFRKESQDCFATFLPKQNWMEIFRTVRSCNKIQKSWGRSMGFLVSHEGEELLYTTPLITLLCWHNSTNGAGAQLIRILVLTNSQIEDTFLCQSWLKVKVVKSITK